MNKEKEMKRKEEDIENSEVNLNKSKYSYRCITNYRKNQNF